jgi:hypothetical protein
VNVQILSIPIILLLLSGCSVLPIFKKEPAVKPVEIQTKAVERTRLNIPDPAPLVGRPMQWYVITPENSEEMWAKLKEENADLVLFGLTDEGYEQLAISIAEIRNFIARQRAIIIKYREYYEPEKQEENKK